MVQVADAVEREGSTGLGAAAVEEQWKDAPSRQKVHKPFSDRQLFVL